MKYDLHVHSNYSDGDFTMDELSILAKKNNLGGFAITDHDTVAGWAEIENLRAKHGIIIMPGVEISTEFNDTDVHILAYGLTLKSKNTLDLLGELYNSRFHRTELMVEKLRSLGFDIEAKDVFAISGQGSPGRPHIAKLMVQKGYAKTEKEVFEKYISRGSLAYVPRKKVSPFECVKLIKSDGGFGVLAHSGIDDTYKLAEKLKDGGLWGLEVFHSSHSVVVERKLKELAENLGLEITGGSDFHSLDDKGHGNLGTKFIETDNIFSKFK
ncbi:MAG: PHP domain-containing protein [Clostridiales bacterium]